ncbi:MAG: hypothetical protein HYX35_04895 [Proteobacteria bacterium]|nr:hypothetical protein [Pseudomonadota bacterium]
MKPNRIPSLKQGALNVFPWLTAVSLLFSIHSMAGESLHPFFYKDSRTVFDIGPEKIHNILLHGAWNKEGQSITSAETNNDRNLEPQIEDIAKGDNTAGVNAFADIEFDQGVSRVLDVGGGKFDVCRKYLEKRKIELLVWDPYNRTVTHNLEVERSIKKVKVDSATSMAVLNVIPEPEVRLKHIATLKEALKNKGIAYFKVWPGEGKLKGSNRHIVNAYGFPGYQANSFAREFLVEVELVFGKNHAQLHPTIPNLIVAKKESEDPSSVEEIKGILKSPKPRPKVK